MIDISELVRQESRIELLRNEAELRRLLGMWVSELEPVMYFNREGRFVGIGFGVELGQSAEITLRAFGR